MLNEGRRTAAEALAALALTREGFDVALPIFKQPSFGLISKWGRVLNPIQIKTGSTQPNGKTGQWKTTKHVDGLYVDGDCTYFALVLVPRNEIWCSHF